MDKNLQDRLPDFMDLLLDAVFLVDAEGRVAYASAACERILGYTPDELVGRSLIELVAPEDRARTLEEARQVMAGHLRIGFENRYLRKDGGQARIMWSARWSAADRLRVGVARDVTGQKHAEEMQAATYAISEAAHSATDLDALLAEIHRIIARLVPLEGLAVAICDRKTKALRFVYQRDRDGNPLVVNEPVACQYCTDALLGGRPMVMRGDALAVLHHGEDSGDADPWLTMPLITHDEPVGAMVLKSAPGAARSDTDQELLHFVSAQVATAIERRQLHAELLHAARYDDLTGLPNRRLFHDRMRSALATCRRKQSRMALLYLDLDDFKQVNDAFGHLAGDVLLQEVARRLEHCVREADTVARLGGDEFVVLLEEVHGPADASAVAEKIRAALAQPISAGGLVLQTRASVGIALYPEHGIEVDQLLKHADVGMYQDKNDPPGAAR